MGRKSKLSERQWQEIGRRLLAGEKGRALAKEYGVSEAAIRARFSAQNAEIKSVANQIVATESALKSLPISAQIAAQDLAAQLRSISGHLAGAANFSAATAHRLAGIAHAKVQEIDDAAPFGEKSMEALKVVAVLTKTANEAGVLPTNLVAANKDMVRAANAGDAQEPGQLLAELVAHLPD
ncbi:MAG: helix-turn-helix domain-containing protein [Pseudomonadota bacterium]